MQTHTAAILAADTTPASDAHVWLVHVDEAGEVRQTGAFRTRAGALRAILADDTAAAEADLDGPPLWDTCDEDASTGTVVWANEQDARVRTLEQADLGA